MKDTTIRVTTATNGGWIIYVMDTGKDTKESFFPGQNPISMNASTTKNYTYIAKSDEEAISLFTQLIGGTR